MHVVSTYWVFFGLWKELKLTYKIFLIFGAFILGSLHASFLFISPFLILLLRFISLDAFSQQGSVLLQSWKELSIRQQPLLQGLYLYSFSLFVIADCFYFLGDFFTQSFISNHWFDRMPVSSIVIIGASFYYWVVTIYMIPAFLRLLKRNTTTSLIFLPTEVGILFLLLALGLGILLGNVFLPNTFYPLVELGLLSILWCIGICYSQRHTTWEVPS